jgi:predicted DNA-binding WGR domain protein
MEIADEKLQILVLERGDESRNMACFYVLAIEPTLFAEVMLAREWDPLGSPGRSRLDLFGSAMALDVWLARKTRREYRARAQVSCLNWRSR